MAAASSPTLDDVQRRVRHIGEQTYALNSKSVKDLEFWLRELNACAEVVSKLLDTAKQVEKAKKAERFKTLQSEMERIQAEMDMLKNGGDVIVVSPAQEVIAAPLLPKAAPAAADVIAAPPPPKVEPVTAEVVAAPPPPKAAPAAAEVVAAQPLPKAAAAPRKQAGRGVSPKSAGGASPSYAMPPPKPAAPVKRACEDVPADTKRRKTIPKVPPPAAAAAADVPPPAAAVAADVPPPAAAAAGGGGEVECTQEVDWTKF